MLVLVVVAPAGVLLLLIFLALLVLNVVATFKIITKAGYSGWWMVIPLAPLLIYMTALAYSVASLASVNSFSSFDHFAGFRQR